MAATAVSRLSFCVSGLEDIAKLQVLRGALRRSVNHDMWFHGLMCLYTFTWPFLSKE